MPRSRVGLVAAALILVHGFGPAAQANPPKLNLYNKVVAAHDPVVNQLMAAKQLLLLANHDYAGHRSKAGYEISAAVHEILHPGSTASQLMMSKKLGQGLSSTMPSPISAPRTVRTGNAASQAASNSKLINAAQILTQVQAQVPATKPAVKLHIQAALDEISIALSK